MNYTFYEFDIVACGNEQNQIPKKVFEELKNLVVLRSPEESYEPFYDGMQDISRCLSLSVKRGREVIQFKNYVGTIALPCGVSIEILPKIAIERNAEISRKLVIEMLKASGNIPYKTFENANVRTDNVNLFEIYIRLFLNELYVLSKKGFRAGYVNEEVNETFLRGKLLFNEQIRYNNAHKEKFYVSHDEYNFNRPENRIIKTTLNLVRHVSKNEENLKDIRRFLLMFEDIDFSENIDSDFAKCSTDRLTKDYMPILKLCKVFLKKKGFTIYGGENNVIALLFPMEKLFEKYIAHEMRRYAKLRGWTLHEQAGGLSLFDNRKFALRPDILLECDGQKIIVDTKWKRLYNDKSSNYGISQADMYQMYAYHTRYPNVSQVVLLYPFYEPIEAADYLIKDMSVQVSVRFFNLIDYIRGKSFGECVHPQPILI